MSNPLLQRRLEELEAKLVSGLPLGPSREIPFGIFVYDPHEELELRRQVELLATRLGNQGRPVTTVDLGQVLWECLESHPAGAEALFEAEEMSDDLDAVLREGHALLVGTSPHEPGPLESRLIERLQALDPKRDLAFLIRAGELFPIYRTSALLERLMGHVQVPSVLFYPGVLYGPTELRFMGVCEPSPNYRPTIFG